MDGPSTSWADISHEALAESPVVHCFVPQCPSTSSKFPNKLFLAVPKDPKARADWLEASGKLYVVSGSQYHDMHCCEDHFDVSSCSITNFNLHVSGLLFCTLTWNKH